MSSDRVALVILRLADADVRSEGTHAHQRLYGCGHRAHADFDVYVKEPEREEIKLEIPDAFKARASHCGPCTRTHVLMTATLCRACKRLILLGQEVAADARGICCVRNDCPGEATLSAHWDGEYAVPIATPRGRHY